MKIVINNDYGGFSLSRKACLELRKRNNKHAQNETVDAYGADFYLRDIPRDDPDLIKLLEEWGSKRVSGRYASLKVVEIPDNVDWEIDDYDGREIINEVHRSWY